MICHGCGGMTWFKDYCLDCARNEALFLRISTGERIILKLPEHETRDTSMTSSWLLSAFAISVNIFKHTFRW